MNAALGIHSRVTVTMSWLVFPAGMKQEGIYGWATVNFLRGHLVGLSRGAGTVNVEANVTAGALDLGGASTQISFFKSDQASSEQDRTETCSRAKQSGTGRGGAGRVNKAMATW